MGQDDGVTLSAPALGALAGRLRAVGLAIGDARDRHQDATAEPVDPVTAAHRAAAARWTSGLRVAAAATVEVGHEIDRYVSTTSATDDAVGVEFRGLPTVTRP